MSELNPSAAASGEPQSADIRQLAALLGNLMPLLLHFQSHVLEQPFQGGGGHVVIPNPALDQQAAVNLVGDITADSLRNLSSYLETNAGSHSALHGCVPIVTQAAHRFAAGDYAQTFNLIWQAYRMIATVRAADSRIPPMQASPQAPSDQTQSIH